jgi:hypothetical protein
MAYYRAGHQRLNKASPEFWITVDGNFIDMAVIEWFKLFGDRNGKHYWAKVITDRSRFETQMLHHLGMTLAEFAAYIDEMRRYRDKFIAHLDDLKVMEIPFLDRAWSAVDFYHGYIVAHEAPLGGLDGLPADLPDYYRRRFDEAQATYRQCGL